MINGNDGGANVSFDGGVSWSRQNNQPTAQFYHVATDTGFPYRVYGAQQDNSTVSISSRNRLGGREDFHPVGGGESGYIAPHPDDPNIVFAGSYGGYLTRYDHRLRKTRNITVWPENPIGSGAADLMHRFQWTFPIVISPHDPNTLYVGGEVLFRSTDEGASWQIISPDLTTDDRSKQQSSGGPITKDNTSVEYYCTIFAVAESPLEPGLIWVGTDDGLVHVTSDGGESWENVTPAGMGDWPLISLVEASPHDADTAYLAVNRYKMDDFSPYVYRTTDRGRTWDLVAEGIAPSAFVRAVREDPVRPGLLYAGTETGVWVSFDAGDRWQPLQLDLPVVPITDLVVHDDDLVLATQGRSFWILEGLTLLRQLAGDLDRRQPHLFEPAPTYRQRWDDLVVHYHLPEELDSPAAMHILDGAGEVIRSWRIELGDDAPGERGDESGNDEDQGDEADDDTPRLTAAAGMNTFRWNLRYPDPESVPGAVGWPGTARGPRTPPGPHTVRLETSGTNLDQPVDIRPDPRLETTPDDYQAQFDMARDIGKAVSETHRAVNTIRSVRRQIETAVAQAKRAGLDEEIAESAEPLKATLSAIENKLIQTRSKAPQDPLNFPVMLNDKLSALSFTVSGDYGPTAQSRQVFQHLRELLDEQLGALGGVLDEQVPAFNRLVAQKRVPAVVVEEERD
jgi:hypothetical protein